jgi:hypothetical protein
MAYSLFGVAETVSVPATFEAKMVGIGGLISASNDMLRLAQKGERKQKSTSRRRVRVWFALNGSVSYTRLQSAGTSSLNHHAHVRPIEVHRHHPLMPSCSGLSLSCNQRAQEPLISLARIQPPASSVNNCGLSEW